jgi:4,4'-diaponeurosporenoate glycosyltransferase
MVRVTIVVPARNEAQRLPRLLASLTHGLPDTAQVVVVDDHSSDGTAEIARGFPHVRVVASPDVPAGWTGKTWACYTGAREAPPGDLVFLDADVELGAAALARALALRRERGGVVSVWPFHRVVRFYEHLSALYNVTCLMGIGAGSLFPPRNLREAVGPMIVTTTEDYQRVGGHEAVRSDVVEDLKLGRRYAELEFPVTVLGGGSDVSTRMYGEGPLSLILGCMRNLGRGAFVLSPLRIAGVVLWIAGAWGSCLWAGGLSTLPSKILTVMFAVQMYVLFRQMGTFGWIDAVLYPVHVTFFVAMFVLGVLHVQVVRRVYWRGRIVRIVDDPGPGRLGGA